MVFMKVCLVSGIYTSRKMTYCNTLDLLLVSANNSSRYQYWWAYRPPADTNNILLVAVILRRPISKIGVLFGTDLLSGPTPIL
jgi:hypothetical protein